MSKSFNAAKVEFLLLCLCELSEEEDHVVSVAIDQLRDNGIHEKRIARPDGMLASVAGNRKHALDEAVRRIYDDYPTATHWRRHGENACGLIGPSHDNRDQTDCAFCQLLD